VNKARSKIELTIACISSVLACGFRQSSKARRCNVPPSWRNHCGGEGWVSWCMTSCPLTTHHLPLIKNALLGKDDIASCFEPLHASLKPGLNRLRTFGCHVWMLPLCEQHSCLKNDAKLASFLVFFKMRQKTSCGMIPRPIGSRLHFTSVSTKA
jgi:hypothetical protein